MLRVLIKLPITIVPVRLDLVVRIISIIMILFFLDQLVLKFIYSEKATKFCEIFTLLLSYVVPVKSMEKILQNFVVFSEYMNFNVSLVMFGMLACLSGPYQYIK